MPEARLSDLQGPRFSWAVSRRPDGAQKLGLPLDCSHTAAWVFLFVFWSISDHPVASSRKLEVSVWVGQERQAPCPSHAGLGCQLWGPQDPRKASVWRPGERAGTGGDSRRVAGGKGATGRGSNQVFTAGTEP